MNKIKSLISAFAFVLITTASFANDNIGPNTMEELRAEIASHLTNLDFSSMTEDSATFRVQFLVNEANEVIVLSVDDENFDGKIKSKLNYKKLDTDGVKKNTVISIPVTFKK